MKVESHRGKKYKTMRAWNAAKSLVTSIQHEYQHKKSLKLSNICWLVVRICVVTQTERRKSLICFIFTICYILWLDFDRILDGIVRSHSRPESTEHSFCCCWRFFCELNIFSRYDHTLDDVVELLLWTFCCANTSSSALVLVSSLARLFNLVRSLWTSSFPLDGF